MEEFLNFFKVKKNLINLLILAILVVGLPLAVNLVKQQQIIKSQAAAANIEFEDGTCVATRNNAKVAICKEAITLKLTSPYGVGTTTTTPPPPPGGTTPPPPPGGTTPPPPPGASTTKPGTTAPGGTCKDNPAPEAVPAGYIWKAACTASSCTPTADGKGSPACPQNTFDASNVNPATSNWCYGFEGGGKCMMLVRPTCQKAGDAGCAAVPLSVCDNGQDGPLDQTSKANNPNFESMRWVTDCNKYCSTRNDCPTSTDQGISGDNTRWCYGFGKDINGADQNRCMMLKWGRACTLDWFGTSTLSNSCISCINSARPDVGAYYKGDAGQGSCSDRRIINDWCTKVDPGSCNTVKSNQCASQCGGQTSSVTPPSILGGLVTTAYAQSCDDSACGAYWGEGASCDPDSGEDRGDGCFGGTGHVEPPVEQCQNDDDFTQFERCESGKAVFKCPATGAERQYGEPYSSAHNCVSNSNPTPSPAGTCTGPGCNTNCSDNPPQTPHGANQTWKADCSSTCSNNNQCPKNTSQPGSIDPNTSAWCYGFKNGNKCLQLRSTGSTTPPPPGGTTPPPPPGGTTPPPPGSGTTGPTYFRFAENPTALAAATWQVYATEPTTISYSFADSSTGKLFVYAEFKNAAGQITAKTVNINFVGPNPAISSTVCSLDSSTGAISINITGTNFGATQGTSRVTAGSNNTTVKTWGNTNVVTELPNASTGTQSLNISLTRSDGAPAATSTCTVGVSQVSLGAALFCHAKNQKTVSNVSVSLQETGAVGIGVTSPVNPSVAKETVSIDANGVIQGLKAKIQAGKKYKLAIKAPKSIRIITPEFTGSAGTTNVTSSPLSLPVGDVFPIDTPDGRINALDKAELNRQWVVATTQTGRTGDFNQDGKVNSIDWACMRENFNKEDASDLR